MTCISLKQLTMQKPIQNIPSIQPYPNARSFVSNIESHYVCNNLILEASSTPPKTPKLRQSFTATPLQSPRPTGPSPSLSAPPSRPA